MTDFHLPDLGEGLEDAEIVAWHVSPGDRVVEGQPLVAVETDKAVVEIPSPQAGTIATLLAAPGARVKVGAPLVTFTEGGSADTGAIVGSLVAPQTQPAAAAAKSVSPAPVQSPPVQAMPRARALARQVGVDLATVPPTGPDRTVTEADVKAAVARRSLTADAGEPLHGPRRAMARNMARAHARAVPATVHDEADVAAWACGSADVTARLVRAIVSGCRASPALNAWFDDEAMVLHRHAHVDLAFALETDDGLFTPVVRDAASLDPAGVRAAIERLKSAVRQRTVRHDDLSGGTITLSNFGTLAGRHAALVVSPPQVAILGAGRIADRPVVRDQTVAAGRTLPLSLTFDHRVVTGAEAARFLAAVISDLERR